MTMGMGFQMGMGIPWDSHGNGNWLQDWEWEEWEGMGIDCTGMGGSGDVKSHSRSSLLSTRYNFASRTVGRRQRLTNCSHRQLLYSAQYDSICRTMPKVFSQSPHNRAMNQLSFVLFSSTTSNHVATLMLQIVCIKVACCYRVKQYLLYRVR